MAIKPYYDSIKIHMKEKEVLLGKFPCFSDSRSDIFCTMPIVQTMPFMQGPYNAICADNANYALGTLCS